MAVAFVILLSCLAYGINASPPSSHYLPPGGRPTVGPAPIAVPTATVRPVLPVVAGPVVTGPAVSGPAVSGPVKARRRPSPVLPVVPAPVVAPAPIVLPAPVVPAPTPVVTGPITQRPAGGERPRPVPAGPAVPVPAPRPVPGRKPGYGSRTVGATATY